MNFIRLLNDVRDPSEYYFKDLSVQYLSDIKDLNIIVGANNTRKSRFIRQIINLEQKIIIKSDLDLNKVLQETHLLFSEVNDMDEKLISFVFNTPQTTDTETYTIVKEFFDKRIDASGQLNFFDIEKTVITLKEEINSLSTKDNIDAFRSLLARQTTTIKLIYRIYHSFEKSFNHYSFDTLNPSGNDGISYKLPNVTTHTYVNDYEEKLSSLKKVLDWLLAISTLEILPYHNVEMVYIPVLRGSRKLEGAGSDIFKKTIKNQYKLPDVPNFSIETGLDLYEKIEAARNGHRVDRDNFEAFEKFLSDTFFQSKEIDIIAVKSKNEKDNHVKVSIQQDNDDIAIHNLGDGVQAIIILLLPIFTANKDAWIFIDEPENNLHPGYQNILLKAISENPIIKKKELKFFINTHSNHILSEALLGTTNTEIFVFSRRDKNSSNINVFSGNEHNTLEMLGVFNTSVLISNCTIWVEGITDRLYIRAFLKALTNSKSDVFPELVEGFQYSFVEYAGNNLIHYTFDHELSNEPDRMDQQMKAYFINSSVFLLADSDFSKDPKHAFYDNIAKRRKNFEYFKTEVPEIENLIPDNILKDWLIKDINCDESEVNNMFEDHNTGLKLGAYFDKKLNYRKKPRKFMKLNEGGTLRSDYKNRLANYVHNGVSNGSITWGQLQESTILNELVERLHKFIIDKNR